MIKFLLSTGTLCLLFLVSCNKYEDGPWLSLRSKNNRLQKGVWEVEEVLFTETTTDGGVLGMRFWIELNDSSWVQFIEYLNGSQPSQYDTTFHYTGGYTFDFKSGGTILINPNSTSSPITEVTWDWQKISQKKEAFTFSDFPVPFFSHIPEIAFKVTRLTNKELWFETRFHSERGYPSRETDFQLKLKKK
ncbi:MAG: hypothetical protein ACJAY8_001176 [Sphingobacteriales bacterium]|jgi:hypothetical protein